MNLDVVIKMMALVIAMVMTLSMMSVVAFADAATSASITITKDETYSDEGTPSNAYTYNAYKIFDAKYNAGDISGANSQSDKEEFGYDEDKPVSYFMATGNPWISTIQGMAYANTDDAVAEGKYFDVAAAADGTGYTVTLHEGVNNDDTTAKAIAEALNTALTRETSPVNPTGDYAPTEVVAGGSAVSVDPGYYLIKSSTASILALVTTDVTLVEKNDYTKLIKEFTTETTVGDFDAADDESTSQDDSVQVGDTVSYTLTVYIPAGANQAMVVTDSFTSGLDPVLATDGSGKVAITVTGLTGTATASAVTAAVADNPATTDVDESTNAYFTVSIDADTVTANAGNTITIVYQAVVTEDAAYEVQENTGKVKYGNNYETNPDTVDSQTYNLEIDKKAESTTGDDLGGAKFELYRTDTDHTLTKAAVSLVKMSDADVTAAGITSPVTGAVYYRVADKNDAAADITTTIDMTEKDGDNYKYTKAVILGLDGDSTYYARETLAPTGYNKLDEDVEVAMNDANHVQPVVNNAGSVLPSTGGIGTTIFYIVGAILVIGAGILLVTRRRMRAE